MSDVGLETVRFIYDRMKIDREWSVWHERGFTWWGHELAQHVWADPCFEDHGFKLSRIHVRTDLLADFAGSPDQLCKLMLMSLYATLSGPIRNPAKPSEIQLASSIYVHADTVNWLKSVMSWVAAIQAAEAQLIATDLAALTRAQPAFSAHPKSGPRYEMDDKLNIIAGKVAPEGQVKSRYADGELRRIVEVLQQPPCVFATGHQDGLSAEFPYGDFTSLLQLKTEETNPRLGHGLLMLLEIPGKIYGAENSDAAEQTLLLNELELSSLTRSHFLGSWCPGHRATTFVSFFPNSMHMPGLVGVILEKAIINRSFWMAEHISRVGTDFDRALQGKTEAMNLLAEGLEGMREAQDSCDEAEANRPEQRGRFARSDCFSQPRAPHPGVQVRPPAIRFPCPTCGKTLKAPAEKAGHKSRCPYCRNGVTVPSAG